VKPDVANGHVVILDLDAPPLSVDVLELTNPRHGGDNPAMLFSQLLNGTTASWR
jgi:hypothetical protein